MFRTKRAQSPRSLASTSKQPNSSPSKKFRSAGQSAGASQQSSTMLGERFSPSSRNPQTNEPSPFSLPPYNKTATATTVMDENDRSSVSDNDSVHSPQGRNEAASIHPSSADDKPKPAPGKKTRGRVKIEMQYIQNKLRRYTTFSKRKSGIMKKAYELSTLTGTQVMLLVASETGHVYTFATPKLQPMITSEAGKALIQTCLHTPDPPPQASEYDIRMSATGYEETELGYGLSDEEAFKNSLETHQLPHQVLTSGSVVVPPMMQMPFAPATLPEQHQPINTIMHPASYQMAASSGPTMSPHTHSPPPNYSPTAHATSPRNYPGSPTTIPYSQSSHLPPQHMIMEELTAGGSPLRKSPDAHYLSHHHFDRSPSHSPMTTAHFPMRTHSPPHQIYAHSGGSPSQMTSHSPMGHM